MARQYLTAPQTYYIASTGSDTTGDGSSANPWATPVKAYDWCRDNLDLGGQKVTIQLKTPISGSFLLSGPMVGQKYAEDLQFYGDDSAWGRQANFGLVGGAGGYVMELQEGARCGVRGVQLSSSSFGLVVGDGKLVARNIWLNGTGSAAFDTASNAAAMTVLGDLVVLWPNSGNPSLPDYANILVAEDESWVSFTPNITISGSPLVSGAFVQADLLAMVDLTGLTVANYGSCRGRRYNGSDNSVIFTGGSGNVNLLPGNAAGTTSGGAIYR